MDSVKIVNKDLGFSFRVPSSFVEVSKDYYDYLGIDSNTLYSFKSGDFTNIFINLMGEAEGCLKDYLNFTLSEMTDFNYKILEESKDKIIIRLEKDGIKYYNYLIIINNLVINFSINSEDILLLEFITDSIRVFTPINIPKIDKTYEIPKKEIAKSNLKEEIFKKEYMAKGIEVPTFYFKYKYNDSILTIINDDLTIISNKKLNNLKSNKINSLLGDLINKYKEELLSFNYSDISNNYLVIKKYNIYLVDLDKDKEKISSLLNDLKEVLENLLLIDLNKDKLFIINNKTKEFKAKNIILPKISNLKPIKIKKPLIKETKKELDNKGNEKLKEMGFNPVDIEYIYNKDNARRQDKDVVLKRSISIIILCKYLLNDSKLSYFERRKRNKNLKDELKMYDAEKYLTKEELRSLETYDELLNINLLKRIEFSYILLYSIGLGEKLLGPSEEVDINKLYKFITKYNLKDLEEKIKEKDLEEILELGDLYERFMMVLNTTKNNKKLDFDIVSNRRLALKWLLSGLSMEETN